MPFSPPEDFPHPGTEPTSHVSCIGRRVLFFFFLAGGFFTTSATWKDPTLAELDQKLESVTEHGELFISEVELCAR